MGARGPVGKRSNQRLGHRSKAEKEAVDRVPSDGQVRGPELTGTHSAAAKRFYEALRTSGQAIYYEPSDWAYVAEIICPAIDTFVKKPSAMMLQSLNSAMANLLVTEGDRRRVRLELEREEAKEAEADVEWIDDARRRLQSG